MRLQTDKWKEFLLGDLFDICAGIYHYPEEYEEGLTPYVSASNENNGISQYINLPPDFIGNCIVTGKVGCTAFYQSDDFCATSDVNILRAKNFTLNKNIALFIVSVINVSENYKWNYGRQCRVGDSKEIVVKLPILYDDKTDYPIIDYNSRFSEKGYVPDFYFMELYIDSLHSKMISTKNPNKKFTFDINTWKTFSLNHLFTEIYKAEPHVKGEMNIINIRKDNSIHFISRTEENNGCDGYIIDSDLSGIEKGNAIIIGDTTSTCFYQENDFIAGDHIVVCRADWINKYTALFIKTIIDKEHYRYSYGRAFKMDLIKNTKITLPSKEEKPDWDYMENYIKSLPYGDRI